MKGIVMGEYDDATSVNIIFADPRLPMTLELGAADGDWFNALPPAQQETVKHELAMSFMALWVTVRPFLNGESGDDVALEEIRSAILSTGALWRHRNAAIRALERVLPVSLLEEIPRQYRHVPSCFSDLIPGQQALVLGYIKSCLDTDQGDRVRILWAALAQSSRGMVVGNVVLGDERAHVVSLDPLDCDCEEFERLNSGASREDERLDCRHTLAKRLSDAAR